MKQNLQFEDEEDIDTPEEETMDYMFAESLNSSIAIETDPIEYYQINNRVCLGTREPMLYYHYRGTQPKEEDWVWFPVSDKEAFNILLISKQGRHKTTIIKNFISYLQPRGYRITYFEGKSASTPQDKNGLPKYGRSDALWCQVQGSGTWLHYKEKPLKIPVYGILPSFVASEKNEEDSVIDDNVIKEYEEVATLSAEQIKTALEWQRVLKSDGVAAGNFMIVNLKKFKTIKNLIKALQRQAFATGENSLHPAVAQLLRNRLETLDHIQVFETLDESTELNIGKIWDKYKNLDTDDEQKKNPLIAVSFHQHTDDSIASYYVEKVLLQQQNYCRKIVEPKLNIYDDCSTYLGWTDNKQGWKKVQQSIELGRSNLFSNIIASQNPLNLGKSLMEACTDKLIGPLDDFSNLSILSAEMRARLKSRLRIIKRTSKDGKVVKCCPYAWIPDNPDETIIFYAKGSPCGNSW